MHKLITTHQTRCQFTSLRCALLQRSHAAGAEDTRHFAGLVNKGITPPWGGEPAFNLMPELHFADEQSFATAMASAEHRAAGKDALQFAGDLVTLATAKEQ